jgi:hypothetical protein
MISVSMLPEPKTFCGGRNYALFLSGSFCCEPADTKICALRTLLVPFMRVMLRAGNSSKAMCHSSGKNRLVSPLLPKGKMRSALFSQVKSALAGFMPAQVFSGIKSGRNFPSDFLHPP